MDPGGFRTEADRFLIRRCGFLLPPYEVQRQAITEREIPRVLGTQAHGLFEEVDSLLFLAEIFDSHRQSNDRHKVAGGKFDRLSSQLDPALGFIEQEVEISECHVALSPRQAPLVRRASAIISIAISSVYPSWTSFKNRAISSAVASFGFGSGGSWRGRRLGQ